MLSHRALDDASEIFRPGRGNSWQRGCEISKHLIVNLCGTTVYALVVYMCSCSAGGGNWPMDSTGCVRPLLSVALAYFSVIPNDWPLHLPITPPVSSQCCAAATGWDKDISLPTWSADLKSLETHRVTQPLYKTSKNNQGEDDFYFRSSFAVFLSSTISFSVPLYPPVIVPIFPLSPQSSTAVFYCALACLWLFGWFGITTHSPISNSIPFTSFPHLSLPSSHPLASHLQSPSMHLTAERATRREGEEDGEEETRVQGVVRLL